MYFNQLFSYFKECIEANINSVAIFSMSIPTIILNNSHTNVIKCLLAAFFVSFI